MIECSTITAGESLMPFAIDMFFNNKYLGLEYHVFTSFIHFMS